MIIDLQIAVENKKNIPTIEQFNLWLDLVLKSQNIKDEKEVTIRIVDQAEIQALNREYRNKDKPTNILSFPFEVPAGISLPLIGDLIICDKILETEAIEQNKNLIDHWTHIVIHGCLHLLGFDHIQDEDAKIMEALEINLLNKLNIENPYLAN